MKNTRSTNLPAVKRTGKRWIARKKLHDKEDNITICQTLKQRKSDEPIR
jgi:hypothetical protein